MTLSFPHIQPPFFLLMVGAIGLSLVAGPAASVEPTPPPTAEEPPEPVTNAVEPVATRIIVKYVEAATGRVENLTSALQSAAALSEVAGAELRHVQQLSGGAQLVEVVEAVGMESAAARETVTGIAARLAEDPAVDYAEPDAIMQIQQAVNDPMFGQQWHYTQPGTGVNLPAGWLNSTGQGAVVAVIDSGFRPHADLAGNLLPGYDLITNTLVSNDGDGRDADARDPGDWITAADTWCPLPPSNSSWHGTHVAGTVAAVTDNALGVAGVAPDVRVVPVRVLGKCGGNLSDIADGMRWAAGLPVPGLPLNTNPADVLNLSLGGSGSCGPTYQGAIDDIVAVGATVVVAAGNSNADASNFRPANCTGVITVASTNIDGARAYYSNFGSVVEIAAPGGETFPAVSGGVLSTLNTGTTTPVADSYAFYQGTSMAAPHVAGIAALLYGLNPSISPAEVATVLQTTAQPFPAVGGNQCNTADCGAGIVDAGAATAAVTPVVASHSIPWIRLLLGN